MNTPSRDERIVFENFELDRSKRVLFEHGKQIRLGGRALEILIVLTDRAGQLVMRSDLMALVWPDTTVDENALRVHLSSLRKALGERAEASRFIVNEAGRGYRFIGEIERIADPAEAMETTDSLLVNEPPKNLFRVVGRDDVVAGLVGLLEERRFLTIVGPGGIGKTTVALAVAQSWANSSLASVRFIDLAPLTDATLVTEAFAAQLGIAASSDQLDQAIVEAIGKSPKLLIVDNCEHLIDAVTPLLEMILRGAAGVTLLVTSREPLRAEAEWIYRLATLEKPHAGTELSVEEAMTFPAVQLFCNRASASFHDFELTKDDIVAVIDICDRLDGMPLAIEMAAARVDTLDPHDIALKLDDRFTLLSKGRRTALPRHQTLRATLDWSHDLLEEEEKEVFRALSVFRSSFQLEGALALFETSESTQSRVLDALTSLVAKSLVTMDRGSRSRLYRLLDTNRFYASEKLTEHGTFSEISTRHAAYCLELFSRDEIAWDGIEPGLAFSANIWRVDDLRAAFDWAFSASGDPQLGLELVVASAPLWFHLSLPSEYLRILRRAIRGIERTALAGTVFELETMAAYGHALWHAEGPDTDMAQAFQRANDIAQHEALEAHSLRAVWGLWAQAILSGDYARSLKLAEEFETPGRLSGDAATIITADHMLALSYHFMGRQEEAHRLTLAVIAAGDDSQNPHRTNHAQVDGKVAALSLSMRIAWLQGHFDMAIALADECAAEIGVLDHDLTACYGFAIGCIPVALWSGNRERARDWNTMLERSASRRGLRYWQDWAAGFAIALDGRGQVPTSATAMQREVFATVGVRIPAEWLSQRLSAEEDSWCSPELMRVLVENKLRDGTSGASVLKTIDRAIEITQKHQTSAWLLRLALTAANIEQEAGQVAAAIQRLKTALRAQPSVSTNPDQAALVAKIDLLESLN